MCGREVDDLFSVAKFVSECLKKYLQEHAQRCTIKLPPFNAGQSSKIVWPVFEDHQGYFVP